MWEGETVFVERTEDVARQLLPGLAEGFAGRTASKLRVPKAIVAPLIIQDSAIGVFAVHSHDLIPGDLPAITAFAHQVAAAWHKATLLQDLEKSLTGQMRVLEALRESEERYRVFFESAPVSIGLFGADDRVLSANGAMLQLLGCADVEVEQIDLANLYQNPRDRARLMEDLQKDGCVHDLEVLWNRQDGAPICASLTATLLNLDGAEVFLILAQDATARTRALKALRESERKHRRLIQNSMDGIVVLQGLAIRFANRALLEMFGCRKQGDMVGRIFTDFMSPQHRDMMLRSGHARTRRKRAPERYEFRALRKDGAEFDAELFLSNVTFQGSAAQQGIVRDTSKRAREEESAPFARGA